MSMKITIDQSDTKVVVAFTPKEYYLVHSENPEFPIEKRWSLNHRIDRSDKGKDDDIGMPVLFIPDDMVETFKKAGFSWVEL